MYRSVLLILEVLEHLQDHQVLLSKIDLHYCFVCYRSLSFPWHMYRSVLLLLEVLEHLQDHQMVFKQDSVTPLYCFVFYRSGSFPWHMYRSVLLLLEVLEHLQDHQMLLQVAIKLNKIPEQGK